MSGDHTRHLGGCGCGRRDFLRTAGLAAGSLALAPLDLIAAEGAAPPARAKEPATVRAAFLYPPSKAFADSHNGWWSWPGDDVDAEANHYYGSHCTCALKLYGPDGPDLPYLLRRFAHTREGSCAIQVFWKEGDPVTMVRYYPGKAPALDVYAGKVVKSHAIPPAGGCTTNVEVEITDRADACEVKSHHNLLFCGDFARRSFAVALAVGAK